ncbi:hypothetical protein [Demequina muriae]|uniref:EcsC protein family protein n=1 Tax=Demequina muriae TaxID=3051664 RepID=A0ABT8GE54_9MICO|nr:hypothetical protein [Demequina sp. EGI L300058]MDN4479700.1 hypothetical protein [Demequina sp. EGI L300058]
MTQDSSPTSSALALPDDFQERVFKAIAVQRPAATAYIKEIRRRKPDATPAEVMKTIESQYVATTTSASAAAGATAGIPVVGVPVAIGLGVADLLFFYETTALFALCMAELRGIPIDDPERAKAVVLAALLGEKRKSRITEIVLSALPAGATVGTARRTAGATVSKVNPKWGDLLATQLPDSALVPVTIALAKQMGTQAAVFGSVKIGTKAIPVIGAVAGGVTSYYFGSSVVKACREGFSEPAATWPAWLEPREGDTADALAGSRAVVAMRAASGSAKEFGEGVWTRVVDGTAAFRGTDVDGVHHEPQALTAVKSAGASVGATVGGAAVSAAKAAKGAGAKAAGAVADKLKRDK